MEDSFDLLRTMTNGRFDITLHPIKTFVGYPEMLEGLGGGTYEVGHNAVGFFAGLDPGFAPLFTMPGVLDNPRQFGIWFNYYGGAELMAKAYAEYNVHLVGLVNCTPESIHSTKPLRTIADLKGQKIRTPPGLTTSLFEDLGMSPVALPASEIYTALDTGVIDATEFLSPATNWDLGLHEVTEYVLFPSFHGAAASSDLSVNMDAWNKLPDDLKAALEAITPLLSQNNDWGEASLAYEALGWMVDYGIERCTFSAEDWAKAKEFGVENVKEWAAKSELSDEVVTSVLDYLRAIGEL